MTKNPTKIILLFGALFLATLMGCYIYNTTTPIGENIKPLKDLGGPFKLNSLDSTVSLEQYKGNVVVLYFGFLNCAEVCPSSMGVLSAAFSQLPPATYQHVQGLFISVDPERDDLVSLHQFAKYFDDRVIGLTGTQQQIDTLTKQYGVYFDIIDMESSELSYTVDHSSRFYIIDETGKLVGAMSHNTTPVELAAGIERVYAKSMAKK
ncbi:SCO family protein [Photobacterium toruni]|uniref:SCO family protein n=1 Tax=Photobacterium toruni TaxID=1935446 RepID=UPI002110A2BC|nr:SCO family protein [Photobacterium toruni]MEC6813662.1 SCO family protein [Photobacterium toruni]